MARGKKNLNNLAIDYQFGFCMISQRHQQEEISATCTLKGPTDDILSRTSCWNEDSRLRRVDITSSSLATINQRDWFRDGGYFQLVTIKPGVSLEEELALSFPGRRVGASAAKSHFIYEGGGVGTAVLCCAIWNYSVICQETRCTR